MVRLDRPGNLRAGVVWLTSVCLATGLVAGAVVVPAVCHAGPPERDGSPSLAPPTGLLRISELNPDLATDDPRELPMKVRSLLRDEHQFFRGTADLFYAWCGQHCRDWLDGDTGWVRLHGDVHIGNVGTYPITPDGRTSFGVVDLDESVVGPFQFDLLRAMTSVVFAARHNGQQLSPAQARQAATSMCTAYVEALRGRAEPASLPDCQPIVGKLLKEAAAGQLADTFEDYCRARPAPEFKPFRQSKKGRLKDLMEPVSTEERRGLVDAFRRFLSDAAERGQANPYGDPTALTAAVHDVVRWTRLDSAGSQGLHKYLMLVDWPVDGRRGTADRAIQAGAGTCGGTSGRASAVIRQHPGRRSGECVCGPAISAHVVRWSRDGRHPRVPDQD